MTHFSFGVGVQTGGFGMNVQVGQRFGGPYAIVPSNPFCNGYRQACMADSLMRQGCPVAAYGGYRPVDPALLYNMRMEQIELNRQARGYYGGGAPYAYGGPAVYGGGNPFGYGGGCYGNDRVSIGIGVGITNRFNSSSVGLSMGNNGWYNSYAYAAPQFSDFGPSRNNVNVGFRFNV